MKIRSEALEKITTKELALFSLFSSLIILFPFFGSQAVTGPVVNATLFLAVIFLGIRSAVLLSIFPSIIALAVGFLPLPIAPFIPFIVIGNVIMVSVFYRFQDNYWVSVFLASFSKFLFLYISSFFVSKVLFTEIASKMIVTIMSWPQLATALSGGLIAYFIIMLIKNKRNIF
jgi:riboflavin transporter